jgi:hypothetical protein
MGGHGRTGNEISSVSYRKDVKCRDRCLLAMRLNGFSILKFEIPSYF